MECLKEMYRLARKFKTISEGGLLYRVPEVAFELSCEGASKAKAYGMKTAEADWKKDAAMFAKVGLEIATTVFGAEHSETKDWRARNEQDLIAYGWKKMGFGAGTTPSQATLKRFFDMLRVEAIFK